MHNNTFFGVELRQPSPWPFRQLL